jgi:hypothetical protein
MAAASYYSTLPVDNAHGGHNNSHDSQYAYKPYGHSSHASTSSLKPLAIATQHQDGSWYDEQQHVGKSDNVRPSQFNFLP